MFSPGIKPSTMDEPFEPHNVVPGKPSAYKTELENSNVVCMRSCNGSFPDFRTLLSDSEISLRRPAERDCKGKLARNTFEYYLFRVLEGYRDVFCYRLC